VVLRYDEPAAEALVDQPALPPPSKLRDVYSIMAGIFVSQHMLSLGHSPPAGGEPPVTLPRSAVDERAAAAAAAAAASIVPDFGQQAFLQMLDLKMAASESAAFGGVGGATGHPGHLSPRGGPASGVPAACRERRRKGVPNRATTSVHDDDATAPAFTSPHDGSSDTQDAARIHVHPAVDRNDTSPPFSACNGVVGGHVVKLAVPEGDANVLAGYHVDHVASCCIGTRPCRRRGRKFFSISCRICGKRLLQVSV